MYCIENYEKLYQPRDSKQRPLVNAHYVKLPVNFGKGLKNLMKRHVNPLEIFGIWCLLLEYATDQKPQFRGQLLNHQDQPATLEEICCDLDLDGQEEKLQGAISILISLGWMSSTHLVGPESDQVRTESDNTPSKCSVVESRGGEAVGPSPPPPESPPLDILLLQRLCQAWADRTHQSVTTSSADGITIEHWLKFKSWEWILEAIEKADQPSLKASLVAAKQREEQSVNGATGLKPGDGKPKRECKPCTVKGCVPNKAYLFLEDQAYCPAHKAEYIKHHDELAAKSSAAARQAKQEFERNREASRQAEIEENSKSDDEVTF